jgi:putative SOS response-associated peptidase YedK
VGNAVPTTFAFPIQVPIFEYVWPFRQSDRSGRLSRPLKAQRLPKSNFPLRYNVAPTDQIPIVRIDPRDGEREVVMARWD